MTRLIAFFFVCLMSCSCFAQEQEKDADFISVSVGSSASVEPGRPVVFVPQEASSADEFNPEPVLWQPDVGLVQITSFAGQVLQVPNLTHIPSFFVYVQVLPDKSAVVTERISLILDAQQSVPFVRSYPLFSNNKLKTRDIRFLWARYNFDSIKPLWKQSLSDTRFSFFDDFGLASGVHLFELSYLVSNAVVVEGNTSRLFLPILGSDLPYLTENLQVLVTYPEKSHLSSAKAFFGKNNQDVENAYSVYQNEKEHLIYKINGVIPAFADVRLEIIADAKGFGSSSISEKIDENVLDNNAILFAFLAAIILFMYFHFAAWDLKDKSIESAYLAKLRSAFKYDAGVLRWLILKKADAKALFASLLSLFLKKDIDIRLNVQNQIILLRKKSIPASDNGLLAFLMLKHSRQNICKLSLSEQKIESFIKSCVRRQILKVVRRELLIGIALLISSVFIIFGLNSSLTKQLVGIIIIIIAFIISFFHFIRKGDFYSLLRSSFIYYAELPRASDKRLPFDIALDRQCDDALKIQIEDKKISITDLEKMFLTQLKLKGIKK